MSNKRYARYRPAFTSLAALAAVTLLLPASFAVAQGKGKGNANGGGGGSAAYEIVPFAPPDVESSQSFVQDLNETGQAVGYAVLPNGSPLPIHLDVSSGNYTTLVGIARPYGMNNLGQIVGNTATGNVEALFWAGPSALPIALPALPGDTRSFAHAINGAGLVAGYSISADDNETAVVWRVDVDGEGVVGVDAPVALPPLTGGTDSTAIDISEVVNDMAIVAGKTTGQFEEANIWLIDLNAADGKVDGVSPAMGLGTLNNTYSHAANMNNFGDVVGESDNWPVVATFGDVVEPLSVVRKTLRGSAEDINDLQEVVGQLVLQNSPSGGGTPSAFLWKNGKPVDLRNQIDNEAGWGTLWNANVINNAGVIAGWGQFDVGSRGFLLIPNQ